MHFDFEHAQAARSLAPCARCGGKGALQYRYFRKHDAMLMRVCCGNCDAKTQPYEGSKDACDEWNRLMKEGAGND